MNTGTPRRCSEWHDDELRAEVTTAGGSVAVECTDCVWFLPHYTQVGHGDDAQPSREVVMDKVMPAIDLHTGYTGHTVRFTLTTYTPPDRVEQSWMLMGPRRAA
jgi:hypothetical protein